MLFTTHIVRAMKVGSVKRKRSAKGNMADTQINKKIPLENIDRRAMEKRYGVKIVLDFDRFDPCV